MSQTELVRAATVALRDCAQVQAGDAVLVVIDSLHPLEMGLAFPAAATQLDATCDVLVVSSRAARQEGWEWMVQPVTPTTAAAMRDADVVVTITNPYLLGTPAHDAALAADTRIVSLMYFDRFRHPTEMLGEQLIGDFVRMMSTDIPAMNALAERLGRALEQAEQVEITAPGGTDLRIRHAGHDATVLGSVVRAMGKSYKGAANGRWAHSPGGVACVVPGDAEGRLVCDVSMVPLGGVDDPIAMTVEGCRITEIAGGPDARRLRSFLERFEDERVYRCPAEWGIGTNPAAVRSGRFLEEEVRYGIPHVAFGDDSRFDGGANFAPFHSDVMIDAATVTLDGTIVLERGEFRI